MIIYYTYIIMGLNVLAILAMDDDKNSAIVQFLMFLPIYLKCVGVF